ncbi:MAG: tetratricopeptide repeat protein [Gemmatimonadota bacterium]|jgi:hypothetical protein|nr:tetratricopeptide repeat protein [Gemmatimonadota bacterium]
MRRTLSGIPGAAVAAGVVALLYRALYLRFLSESPEFAQPILDGAAHWSWARDALAGAWPPAGEAFFRAPGYVGWLAGLRAVCGGDPAAARTVQLLAGAATPVLTACLAGRLFGRSAAWIAGLGAAVYPVLPFFDGQFLAVSIGVPLFTAALLASADLVEGRGGRVRAGFAGGLWGIAGIVRPPALLPGVLLVVWLVTNRRRRLAAVVALALLLPALAVTLRNASAGDPVFVASQGGLNLYLGNHRLADGMTATFPDHPEAGGYRMMEAAHALAERSVGRTLRSSEVSRHYALRTASEIAADPVRWVRLLGRKALLFCGAREIPNNHDPVLFAEAFPWLRWLPGWGLWAPLALCGAVLLRRRMSASAGFAAAAVGTVLAVSVAFFTCARFRLPAVPILLAFGAGGLAGLPRLWREARARRHLAVGAGVFVLAFATVRSNPGGVQGAPWVGSFVLMADAERARGEPVRALRWLDRALQSDPNYYPAQRARVESLRRMGRSQAALESVEALLAKRPHDAALHLEAGVLHDLSGNPQAALRFMERAASLDPSLDEAVVSRAVVLARSGREEDAAQVLRAFLRARPGSSEAPRARDLLMRVEAEEAGSTRD